MRTRLFFLSVLVIAGVLVSLRPGAPKATRPPSPSHAAARAENSPPAPPPDTVWTFGDGPANHTYAVALNELYVPAGPAKDRLRSLPAQSNLDALLAVASTLAAQTGTQPRLVLYPASGPRNEHTRRIVNPEVHIETDNLDAVRAAAAPLGLSGWTTPDYAPGHALAQVEGDPAQPLRAAARLARLAHVTSATPLLARQQTKRALPNDPLFPQQWHLRNTGQQRGVTGIDVNVTPVWSTLKGSGVAVAVVDDGVQLTHPDLAPNVAASGHYDWNDLDTNPAPTLTDDYHGTAVAGLIAARGDNGIGVSGVAPLSTIYGLRLIAAPTTDSQEADAMAWNNDVIKIKNNSWGPPDDEPSVLGDAGTLWQNAVATGTTAGRGGLGTLYVWAAGNGKADGDQGGKDAYSGNRHVIPVGAVTNAGVSASFSEGGPHLVVCAPGDAPTGIVTTDLVGYPGYNPYPGVTELPDQDYTQTFAGTSAAAPIAAGVLALMLEANPNLGWRDVKEILLRSSTQLEPTASDWVTRTGGQPSLPVIKHHPFYGGGLINAQAATALASAWTPLGPETTVTCSSAPGNQSIPDVGAAVTIPLTPAASPVLRVEHAEITLNIVHSRRGDLEIKLISPSGVVSTLATITNQDTGANYDNWTFSSVRHWGESSAGTWRLSVRDGGRGGFGYFVSATLKLHGVVAAPPVITLDPQDTAAATGSTVALTAAGTGSSLAYQWSRNGSAIPGATAATLNLPGITLAQAGTYACTLSNLGGPVTTAPAKVVVYSTAGQSATLNTGATLATATLAAGPADSYRWFFNNTPLTDSARITGATAGQLTVRSLTPADNGAYTLQAVAGGNPLPTGTVNLIVRPAPAVTAAAAQSVRLGAVASVALTASGGPYTYVYSGLPKGITYSPTTGALAGRTTATGTFPLTLTVSDSAGQSTVLPIALTVEPLPAALVGTFNGYVARDPALNANLGGAITVTTTAKGAFSGKLTLGGAAYAFKGSLDGAAGGPALATASVARKGLAPLQLQLSLPLDGTAATGTLNATVAVTAWRNAWGKTAPASAYAGRYTFALETPAGSDRPAGYSAGTLTVATAGTVTWTLQPADGTAALKGATTLSARGDLPLFAPLKTPAGSFVGALTLPTGAAPITGPVSWLRGGTSSALYAHPGGFGPIALTTHGGRYAAPAAGTVVLGLPAVTNNAALEFGGVDLGAQAAAATPFTFTLNTANKAVTPAVNPVALKFIAITATGQFSGSFTLTDPSDATTVKRIEKFSGVFLPAEGIGAGFFILPALPGSPTGTRSGSVLLIEAP